MMAVKPKHVAGN